jgi:hypothetical protein
MPKGLDEITRELENRAPGLFTRLQSHDSAARLLEELPSRFSPADLLDPQGPQRIWELLGLYHLYVARVHEALALFWRLYDQLLVAQESAGRVHKGMPLVWMSECYARLGYQVHAKPNADALRGRIASERRGVTQ